MSFSELMLWSLNYVCLPVLSKVAEKIALIQFNDFLTKQDKLTQHQSGNRKNHSTESIIIVLLFIQNNS